MTQTRDSSTTPPQPSATDESLLAAALAKIPSGLFVVTWQDESRDRGMLASWVMQAGFAPPTITVAVGVDRDLVAAIERGCRFVINILGESQRPLLARFGRPSSKGDDPFAGLDMSRSPGGGPVLVASVGWLECRAVGRVGGDATDHVVVLAEVTAAAAAGTEPPLVHLRKNGLRY
ncbi:MAG: flavin reductase family protein [Planctomycetia bacterium]